MIKSKMKKKGGPVDHDKVIGANLNKIRLAMQLSQQELAKLAGVTFQQIQKYEKGTNRLSASRLVRISNALDVDIDVFFDGVIDTTPKKISLENIPDEHVKFLRLLAEIDNPDKIKILSKLLSD